MPIALERFERGLMLWFQPLGFGSNLLGNIEVITFDTTRQVLVWQQFQDTWREGEETGVEDNPPPGLYMPTHGFGKLWSTNPDVRAQLGWATEAERRCSSTKSVGCRSSIAGGSSG